MQKKKLGILASALLMGAMTVPVMAQTNNNGGGNGGGNNNGGGGGGRQRGQGGGGGGFQGMRQRMMDQMKTDLGATDDEFTALQPKIEAVMTAQRDANGGMRGMFRGRGGQGGGNNGGGNNGGGNNGGGGGFGGGQGTTSDVQAKTEDLRNTLENKDAKPEEIKAKLDALRDAKAKAKDTLTKAQADLKGMLTARQEAVLVEFGLLD
jgi:hypothetical protein